MKRSLRWFIETVALLGLVAGASGLAKANLVYNGNFATGDFSGWSLSGDTSGVYVSGSPSALYAALTTNSTDGFLTQSIATASGQQYTVSFLLEGDGATRNSLSASLGGTILGSFTNVPDTMPDGATYTYNFTASSASSLLSFDFRDDPGYLYLTNISINAATAATPEPSTASLSLGALILIGCVVVKTRRI